MHLFGFLLHNLHNLHFGRSRIRCCLALWTAPHNVRNRGHVVLASQSMHEPPRDSAENEEHASSGTRSLQTEYVKAVAHLFWAMFDEFPSRAKDSIRQASYLLHLHPIFFFS
jgi:hypothetical protein